jgi:hypothetical protein
MLGTQALRGSCAVPRTTAHVASSPRTVVVRGAVASVRRVATPLVAGMSSALPMRSSLAQLPSRMTRSLAPARKVRLATLDRVG